MIASFVTVITVVTLAYVLSTEVVCILQRTGFGGVAAALSNQTGLLQADEPKRPGS